MDFFRKIFDPSDFPARWSCGKWTEAHGWLHILSDIAIWGAYMAIPIALAYFVSKRRDIPFLPIFWLFAAFIFACGTSHLVEAGIFWWPVYRFSGLVKLATAIVSWLTVAALIPTLPRALNLPKLEKANVELADALSRMRTVFDAAPDGMLVVNGSGRIVMTNQACSEIFDYPSDEMFGMNVDELVPDKARASHPELRREYLEHPQKRPMGTGRDLFGRRRDGSEVAVEIGLNPITIEGEDLVLASIVDISERKRFEAELARLALLVNSTNDSIVGLDLNGTITSWNSGSEATFGYTPEEAIGKPLSLIVPESARSDIDLIIEGAARGETIQHFETLRQHKDGTLVNVELTISPVVDLSGNIVGSVKVGRDITESKRARERLQSLNEQLERSNRELDEFVHVASHDMRTPVEGIRSLATWIEEDAGAVLPEESRQHLGQLIQRAERTISLLDDLLEYSRAGQSGTVENVDTKTIVEDVIAEIGPPEGFTIECSADLPEFRTIETPLRQVFRNLIGNAVKHNSEGSGKIEITSERTGSQFVFTVRDDGPGIAPQYQKRIFEPSETLQSKDLREGSGFGLAIVKKVVESYGGQVWVESEPGAGSAFHFSWPRNVVNDD